MKPTSISLTSARLLIGLCFLLERAAYYGIRALLILFLTAENGWATESEPVLDWYNRVTLAVPLLALPIGWLSDRVISNDKAIIAGGLFMAVGCLLLLTQTYWPVLIAISLLIIGTSLIRPNLWVRFGHLYEIEDRKRNGGFTLGYVMINLGAFAGITLSGWLGERIGWNFGFACCALFGIVFFVLYLWLSSQWPGLKQDLNSTQMMDDSTILDAEVYLERKSLSVRNISFANAFGMIILLSCISFLTYEAINITDTTLFNYYQDTRDANDSWWSSPEFLSPIWSCLLLLIFGVLWSIRAHRFLPSTYLCVGMVLVAIPTLFVGLLQAQSWPMGELWLIVSFLIIVAETLVAPLVMSSLTRWSPKGWGATIVGAFVAGSTLMTYLFELLSAQLGHLLWVIILCVLLAILIIITIISRKQWIWLEKS